jgi:NADH-quinone oxidoreductase subunit J
MLAHLATFPASLLAPILADSVPLSPILILVLCVVAGVGTVLLLPGRREASFRKIGGAVLLAAGLIFAAILVRLLAGDPHGGMGPYFWIFSAIAIIGAIRVITHSKPVYSALYFVLTVFASAGLFLLLWAEFMAAALVLIYAGAILVTYVFVIMLAAEAAPAGAMKQGLEHDEVSRDPVIAASVGFALMGVILFVVFDKAGDIKANTTVQTPAVTAASTESAVPVLTTRPANLPIATGATQELGVYLFQKHLVNIELAGLLLTVSMIGAIVIARRKVTGETFTPADVDVVVAAATPVDDNPHSIPVIGTRNPRQKEYPET